MSEKTRADSAEIFLKNSSGGGVAGTLDASYLKGKGERQGVEREFVLVKIIDDEDVSRKEIL